MHRILSSLVARIRRLPKAVLYAAAIVLTAVFAVGGVFAYRTWDFIEHDNDFCMSCHLMQDPFDRFAESEHRGLGCKACHHPTMVGRSRMALTQIIENPEEIEEHAIVPNEKCVSCHVDGDPEEWTLISRSVGHRVHLESEEPSLEGLQCVECHSSGVHEFAATSQTCGQSGCHENVEIKLGRMGDFTIHCVACHDFSRPVDDEPTLVAAGDSGVRASTVVAPLRPEANECLSCHQMRLLVGEIPEDEPHGAVCGACHNPHEQTTPAEAVQSCAASECHAAADTITPMHRGLEAGTLERCTLCHSPHDSPIEQVVCTSCHADGARIDRGETTLPAHVGEDIRRTALSGTAAPPAARSEDESLRFSHQRHEAVDCTQCHVSEEAHGEVTATNLRECRECHHRPAQAAALECTRCHERRENATEVYRANRVMDLSVGRRGRGLPFQHRNHEDVQCTRCHTRGLELSAAQVDCTSCHTDHHRPEAVCRSCHLEAPASAHPARVVHTTCAGSGCHSSNPFPQMPDTREFCLACHQDMVTHEPQGSCMECHAVPGNRRTVSP